MKVQILEIGDDLGLILPGDLVDSLGLRGGNELHIGVGSDGSLRLDTNASLHKEAMAIVERAMINYADTLTTLAKS